MNKRAPTILGFLVLAMSRWLQITTTPSIRHLTNRLEELVYDMQLRTRLLPHRKLRLAETSVAIIDIDDKSLKTIGRWPWNRDLIATLIENSELIVWTLPFTKRLQRARMKSC